MSTTAPPPGAPRFPLLDSVRGVAVLLIVVFHSASITGAINSAVAGRVGIALANQATTLFFVLSAFLLYRPFVAARAAGRPIPSLRSYGRRRVLRILPGYWVALTVLGLFPGIVGVFSGDWWRFYGFLQLYSPVTFGQGIPQAWTLDVEVTFYLALPLWVLLRRRLPPHWELRSLALVGAVGAILQVLAARQVIDHRIAQALPGQAAWFALGMSLAVWSVRESLAPQPSRVVRLVADRAWLCWLGAAAAAAALTALVHPGGLFGLVVALRTEQAYTTVLPSLVLTAAFSTLTMLPAIFAGDRRGVPQRVLSFGPLAWIGVISYGIYLYHLAIVEWLGLHRDPTHFSARGLGLVTHLPHLATPILFALTLAVCCPLAWVSYKVIERPLIKRR